MVLVVKYIMKKTIFQWLNIPGGFIIASSILWLKELGIITTCIMFTIGIIMLAISWHYTFKE